MKKNILIAGLIIFAISALIIIFYIGTRPPGARVAFVIDDWGYNDRNIDLLFEIERPVTISILPNLRYSNYVAEAVSKGGKNYDIILHLPLEAKSDEAPEVNTIRCNMKKESVVSILDKDIKDIPGIIGVSNHQGSKATEDERVMRIILGELKNKGLFFLDSLTTPDSVCQDIAGNIKLKFARRDVFLDLTDQTDLRHFESYIKRQIQELASIAVKEGSAIGIGHNKRTTLKVIKNMIPVLEKQGIKVVPLKELAE